jgi:hypothetical protein
LGTILKLQLIDFFVKVLFDTKNYWAGRPFGIAFE